MNDHRYFNEQQENELRNAMRRGGIFLKIFDNPNAKVEVNTHDGVVTFDLEMSLKIRELYFSQTKYKAERSEGLKLVSISWFIVNFC